ncbi:hypothetical protein [Propionimicrobium lymphophilum]|uniref:Uncharacterized protein n=1 Tax=Propionimicrobium lymphophilum ACS-093-V-SCH5 TaxID=883161 RepID=S2W2P6_9ACTN|nr:hypothetical protein [Propionimicrobium lymphophilum]EPD34048.1 hypothetical protein HMPREF9306_00082 [Propionimicrobium lymphophilum ACS-093-V-SCH5]
MIYSQLLELPVKQWTPYQVEDYAVIPHPLKPPKWATHYMPLTAPTGVEYVRQLAINPDMWLTQFETIDVLPHGIEVIRQEPEITIEAETGRQQLNLDEALESSALMSEHAKEAVRQAIALTQQNN